MRQVAILAFALGMLTQASGAPYMTSTFTEACKNQN